MESRVSQAQVTSSLSIQASSKKFLSKKMADTVELQEAFKLFDMDGDGMITKDELRKLVEKVGGSMTEGEAKGLIHQADKDGNESIDFSEFSKLWAAIKGEGEGEKEIRKEFSKLDV